MRIRKHAKISPLFYTTSSVKPGTVLQTHICQLNQSPWDAMSFSPPSTPPPCQVNGSGVSAGNGSLAQCISVVERELNTCWPSEYPNAMHKAEEEEEHSPPPPPPPPPPPSPKNELITLCCKTDGKSWRCRREASKGNSLCEHHLSLLKSYSNLAHRPTKKYVKPTPREALPPRRPRPKKDASSSSSSSLNPHEFYYYSGFGLRWGKKRGKTGQYNGGNMPRNAADGHENGVGALALSEEFDCVVYEEDDDDDEIEVKRDNGKKRVRKPIKARSLKSLM